MNKTNVVLLGKIGTGLTTLFNELTNSKEQTQYGGEPSTKQVVVASTKYGKGFNLIDTPGFGAWYDKRLHTAGILAALSYGKMNRILIVVKFDKYDCIIRDLDKIVKPIKRYIKLVTVIVNHWDLCQDQIKQMQEIKKQIYLNFEIDSIFAMKLKRSVLLINKSMK